MFRTAEEEFLRFRKELHLPDNVRLEHALSFEHDQLTLCIDFRDRQQLAEQWSKLEPLWNK